MMDRSSALLRVCLGLLVILTITGTCVAGEWGPESMLDTTRFYGPAPGSQINPAVAYDGTNYLVLWADSLAESVRVCGARVSPSGVVLDSSGILILEGGTDTSFLSPAVAFDGTNYLVASGGTGVFLAPSGSPSGSPFSIPCGKSDAAVAFDGANYLVVGAGNGIKGARVTPQGEILDPSGITFCPHSYGEEAPALVFDGANYLVVWQNFTDGAWWDIRGARVSVSGVVLDSTGFLVSPGVFNQWDPDVAFDGSNCLAVWQEYRSTTGMDVCGTRITPAGEVVDSSGLLIAASLAFQGAPALAFDGSQYVVVYEDEYGGTKDLKEVTVSPSGEVGTSPNIIIATSSNEAKPTLAIGPGNHLVAWQDDRSGPNDVDIRAARISPTGSVLDTLGLALSFATGGQTSPAVASDGSGYLVVWQDDRDQGYEGSDIYGLLVDSLGLANPAGSFPIAAAPHLQASPAVAFNGTNYLVVWQDSRASDYGWDVYGARVTREGTVLDPDGILIFNGAMDQRLPDVASDGAEYLVVWTNTDGNFWLSVEGVRVSSFGEVLDSSALLVSDWGSAPAVAYGGGSYLVVFQQAAYIPAAVYGRRITSGGSFLDSTSFVVSQLAGNYGFPSISFGLENFLTTWGFHHHYLDGTLVSPSGAVPFPQGRNIEPWVNASWFPASSVFDGTDYVVVWPDSNFGNGSDISGARVDTSVTVLESYTISEPSEYDRSNPAIAHGSGIGNLITYEGYTLAPYSTTRVYGRLCTSTGIHVTGPGSLPPTRTVLLQNSPNPFSGSTQVRFSLGKTSDVALTIYNIGGQRVRVLDRGKRDSGAYSLTWDGYDQSGSKVARGVYLCRMEAGGSIETVRMVVIR